MKKILILAGRYLPGYKDGGPVRTLINLTDLLGDEYDFYLAVLDRDHGDAEAYPNIKINEWNQIGKAKVWYYRAGEMNFSLIRKLAKNVNLVYLCGFYSSYGYKTLILNRFGCLFGKPVVIAPMGSFSEGALAQKSKKKKIFITICKLFGLFKNIRWSVTSELEVGDVKREINEKAMCVIAEDPPRASIKVEHKNLVDGEKIKIVFISRVSPKKNLLYAIQVLKNVRCDIKFDIYGPLEDKAYWNNCKSLLLELPDNIKWNYCGEVDTNHVPEIFTKYDLFLFPTLGENYGHVIFEALAAGCVPIISDQTPWDDIQKKKAGYIIPLYDQDRYCKIIEEYQSKSITERKKISENAVEVAKQKVEQSKVHSGYRDIFEWG